MENNARLLCGGASALAALLVPIAPLVACAVVFVMIDFVTGVAASRARVRREGAKWIFSSRRAWDTVTKTVFVMAGIALAWLLDEVVLTFVELHLANVFTGFVCGVEFWSYLENASEISGQPIFRMLRDVLRKRIDKIL